MREVAVLGAGAIGSALGGALTQAGRDVLLVAREDHARAMNAEGLHLIHAAGGDRRDERVAVDAATTLEEAEIVLLTVRTNDVPGAVKQVAEAAPEATVVTLQNGVRSDAMAAEVLGRDAVVGGVLVLDAVFLEPGRVTWNRDGSILLGRPWGPPDETTRRVADLLAAATSVEVRDDLPAARWTKLIVNLNNALPAATGLSVQQVYEDDDLARVATRTMQEGIRAVEATGRSLASIPWSSARLLKTMAVTPLPLATWFARRRIQRLLGDTPSQPSTLQSVLRGVEPEIDYLNGEIVRLGEEGDVATPANRVLVDLVHEVAEDGSFVSPERVVTAVDDAA